MSVSTSRMVTSQVRKSHRLLLLQPPGETDLPLEQCTVFVCSLHQYASALPHVPRKLGMLRNLGSLAMHTAWPVAKVAQHVSASYQVLKVRSVPVEANKLTFVQYWQRNTLPHSDSTSFPKCKCAVESQCTTDEECYLTQRLFYCAGGVFAPVSGKTPTTATRQLTPHGAAPACVGILRP